MMAKHPFEYQAPTQVQTDTIKAFRVAMKQLHDAILQDIPACRERSLAITKLEEVSMWVNKAIVFAPETE